MDALVGQFGINLPLLLAQILNFGILVFVLMKFAYKPILNILDKRRERIENSLKQAKEIEERTRKMEDDITQKLADAKKHAEQIILEAKDIGDKARNEILIQTNKEVSNLIEKAKQEIENEKMNMMADIQEYVVKTSLLVVQKVLADKMDPKIQEQLIMDSMKELPKEK